MKNIFFVLSMLLSYALHAQKASISVDFSKEVGQMKPVWAWFGYDEPNYTYMKDGKKLLSEIAELSPVPVYVRAHNLLTSGKDTMSLKWGSTNAYTEDSNGKVIYDWTLTDKIFDTYIQRGMKPLAQIGFMPEALSIKPQPYQHNWQPGQPYENIYTGWTYPPKDYEKWHALVFEWVAHCVARYGKEEVESWYWELWNEPDSKYWQGDVKEYCKLYDYSSDAVLKALPTARIGGPHVTGPNGKRGGDFLKAFLEHCTSGTNYVTGKTGAPIHFIAFHAKGSPKFIENHVQMNMGTQLRDISAGFKIVSSFNTLKDLPIIIGESDPEGCAACGMKVYPQNAYRNGTMYSSYTAASFARKYDLADQLKVNFLGAVSWSFEFENQPYFYGFRDLATNGIDKPVLNVFRMFGMMQGSRVDVKGNQMYATSTVRDSSVRKGYADIGGLAAKDNNQATLMIWNYHDDDLPKKASNVNINLNKLPATEVKITEYRIDAEHSNAYEVWRQMGEPQNPTKEQYEILEKRGKLEKIGIAKSYKVNKGSLDFALDLPSQGVSLFKIEW